MITTTTTNKQTIKKNRIIIENDLDIISYHIKNLEREREREREEVFNFFLSLFRKKIKLENKKIINKQKKSR